jgi:hypothetical protein
MLNDEEKITKKWELSGLLIGLNKNDKGKLSVILENIAELMFDAKDKTNIVFPAARVVYTKMKNPEKLCYKKFMSEFNDWYDKQNFPQDEEKITNEFVSFYMKNHC